MAALNQLIFSECQRPRYASSNKGHFANVRTPRRLSHITRLVTPVIINPLILSPPNWSRQMVFPPEPGSARGSFSSPLLQLVRRWELLGSILFIYVYVYLF